MTALAAWYLRLWPAYPEKAWAALEALERATSEYQSEARVDPEAFLPHFPELSLAGKDVLDLGCGYGGRTVRFKELGAQSVVGVEISEDVLAEARAFTETRHAVVDFRLGTAEAIPAVDNEFDLVLS